VEWVVCVVDDDRDARVASKVSYPSAIDAAVDHDRIVFELIVNDRRMWRTVRIERRQHRATRLDEVRAQTREAFRDVGHQCLRRAGRARGLVIVGHDIFLVTACS
jgi:hypothetical protein